VKIYRAYNFRTKDPEIDRLRTLIQDTYGPKMGGKVYKKIESDGGPSVTSMYNWFHGKTKRPQSASVEACGRAIGWKRTWVRMDGKGK
jgi:hypothetical protein